MKKINLKSKQVNKELNLNLSKKDLVELVDDKFMFINKEIAFFKFGDKWVPTLKYLQKNDLLKKITVDMGAVKFVVNGADVMRPGIVEIEEFNKEDFIVIIDENNKKPLSVGIALFDSAEMRGVSSGKVIKNIHYVGDDIWKLS